MSLRGVSFSDYVAIPQRGTARNVGEGLDPPVRPALAGRHRTGVSIIENVGYDINVTVMRKII